MGFAGGRQESKIIPSQGFGLSTGRTGFLVLRKRNMGEGVGLERKKRIHFGHIEFKAVGCVSLEFKRKV